MSGGSLDYVCYKVQDAIPIIKEYPNNPLYSAFARHLELVAEALHDLEWALSGDYAKGDEVEAIKKVVNPNMVLDSARENAEKVLKQLEIALKSCSIEKEGA